MRPLILALVLTLAGGGFRSAADDRPEIPGGLPPSRGLRARRA